MLAGIEGIHIQPLDCVLFNAWLAFFLFMLIKAWYLRFSLLIKNYDSLLLCFGALSEGYSSLETSCYQLLVFALCMFCMDSVKEAFSTLLSISICIELR